MADKLFSNSLAPRNGNWMLDLAHLPPSSSSSRNWTKLHSAILQLVATRLHDNYPYGSSALRRPDVEAAPSDRPCRLYALAMSVNPNNHALDGGRASSAMES